MGYHLRAIDAQGKLVKRVGVRRRAAPTGYQFLLSYLQSFPQVTEIRYCRNGLGSNGKSAKIEVVWQRKEG